MARQEQFPRETPRPSSTGAAAPGVTDKVQETASQVADKVQDTASQAVDKVQQAAAPVVDQASDAAGQVKEKAAAQVSSRLDMGKDYAAEALNGVAQALRQTGQHLREETAQPTLGQYADSGAEQLERLTGYLRKHDSEDLIADVEAFARRSPTVFAGGAFALGLLAARFFRSSGQPRTPAPSARTGMPSPSRPPTSGMPPTSRPPVAPASARPPSPGPTPRPAPSQPPSYSSGAPAARTVPGSSDWMPSERPGAGASPSGPSREAERMTPSAGTPPSGGTPPPTGGTTGPGSASPRPDASPSTGATPPSSGRPEPTTRPRT